MHGLVSEMFATSVVCTFDGMPRFVRALWGRTARAPKPIDGVSVVRLTWNETARSKSVRSFAPNAFFHPSAEDSVRSPETVCVDVEKHSATAISTALGP